MTQSQKTFGQIAFEAYKDFVQGQTHDGKPIPHWEELSRNIQEAWSVGSLAAIKAYLKQPSKLDGLTEGRIVHYVLSEGPRQDEHRPAIIVRVCDTTQGTGMCNLQVFNDGNNDVQPGAAHWVGSAYYDENKTPGTWHWVEKA